MRFLVAPDSFKESLTAQQACGAISRGIKQLLPEAEVIELPLADGGEGTMGILVDALGGEIKTFEVTGPLFEPVSAQVGWVNGDTAIIEIAEAAGLHLVPAARRNPEQTTTQGVGELISAMLDQGATTFLIALGGSATNDGGLGMLTALGVRPLDAAGAPLKPVGESLNKVASLDVSQLDTRLSQCQFMLACDVNNPLTGEQGASAVFGPQKGATPEQVTRLDQGMAHWAGVLENNFGSSVIHRAGSGAAGGLGAAFLSVFRATSKQGVEQVLDVVGFDHLCQRVDWVITGEGKIDGQSLSGKTPVGVARRAKKYAVPVAAFAGLLGEGYQAVYKEGIDLALPITPDGMPLDEAIQQGEQNLYKATYALIKALYSSDETASPVEP